MRPQEERIIAPCPAIIPRDLWNQAAARRASRNKHQDRTFAISLMARRLKCECGYSYTAGSGEKDRISAITGRKLKDKRHWYICHGARKQLSVHTCASAPILADQLDPAVWQWVLDNLAQPAALAPLLEAERAARAGERNRAREYLAIMERQRGELGAELAAPEQALAASPSIAHILRRQADERADLLRRYERDLAELREGADDAAATIGETLDWAERMARAGALATPEERLAFVELLDVRGAVSQVPPGGREPACGWLGEERGPGIYVELRCRLPIAGMLALEHRRPRRYGLAPAGQLVLPLED